MSSPGAGTHRPHHFRGATDTGWARAYCGPAHGQSWTVDPDQPPAWVELPVGASACRYRLVWQRHSRRPARDGLGNLLYVPVTRAARGPRGFTPVARVVPLPRPPAPQQTDHREQPAGGDRR